MHEQVQEHPWNIELSHASQVKYQANWKPRPLPRKNFSLLQAVEGRGVIVVDGVAYLLNEGECLWLPVGIMYSLQPHGGQPFTVRSFRIDIRDANLLQRMKQTYPPLTVDPTLNSMLTYLFEHKNDPDHESRLTRATFLRTILTLHFLDDLRHKPQRSAFVIADGYSPATQRLLCLVEENFYRHFALDEIAKELSYHKNYLSSTFSRDTGVPFLDYVNFHRARLAVVFFFFWGVSVAETSERLRFTHPTYFSKIFKKFVGIPPRDFYRTCAALTTEERSLIASNEPILAYYPMPIEELFASLRHMGQTMEEIQQRKAQQSTSDDSDLSES